MAADAEVQVAAILVADIVSYTRLVGTDDVGTIARLKALRRRFVEPTIGEYHGRVVRLTDECMLVEFASPAHAVECAVAIQKGVAEREVDVGEADRIRYRIGVNFGSINVKGDDILGDKVDNATRLATLAEPGGICISRTVYDEVKSELKLQYEQHRDWMNIALMSTKIPDAWPSTMDLIEVSAVKINPGAITGGMFGRLLRHLRRLLDSRFR